MSTHVQWRDAAQNSLMWTINGDDADAALQQAYGRVSALLDSKGHPVDVIIDMQSSATSIVPDDLLALFDTLADSYIGKLIIVSESAAWQGTSDDMTNAAADNPNASVHVVQSIAAADAIIDDMRHQRPDLTAST